MKGAPERVLDLCVNMMMDGELVDLTPDNRDAFNEAYTTLGGNGERALGFCYAMLDEKQFPS